MRISVIIPMYNSSRTIIPVLESVRKQTFIDFILEVIIVNDGSTDDSLSVVNNYKLSDTILDIKVYDRKNMGVSAARNEGMRQANGNWIALLDSDDLWEVDKIEKQVGFIRNHKDLDFLGGDFGDVELRIPFRKKGKFFKATLSDICLKSFPSPSTVIFRKEIYEIIGGFDESFRYAEDGNYFMKICANFNLYHYKEKLASNIFSKPSFGHSGLSSNLKGMYDGNIRNLQELRDNKYISNPFYYSLRVFHSFKYARRILLSNIANFNKGNDQ